MARKELEKAFLEAAEIAKKLPKNLQEAGFNRAVEQLLGKGGPTGKGGRRPAGADRTDKDAKTKPERSDITQLIDSIDRTAHSDVGATSRVADRALKVLQLVGQNHDVDGLTAGEIATILSRKFRFSTKANSVLKALEREVDTVDVRSGAGASRVFHIMAPGDAYLERLRSGKGGGRRRRAAGTARVRKTTTKKAGTRKKKKKTATTKKATKKVARKKATGKKMAGRPGPKAAVGQLLQVGFFRLARTISEIQKELQHRRGHGYSVQELAPALVRSIRDESLTRERTSEGQYEYSEA